ncbi:NAD(P)/FAD-dependent oxidoreductase [Psychromonas antarctica]|uniref:NAD(P)/FAD-dependent oxidoreductase n=1 Tax=Psychromonas antarctica TaxID=67573 RepID=UPI001EE93521|nr:NAD(P)/FAD-dependent oxidoreductase [Psychromonas antarctica]MCG6201259.1 NAD(P)/FAD-dependent oxidoreductase [Psychromonas antarctica]
MIRLNQVKLPLDHSDDALQAFVLNKLSITADQLVDIQLFKRGYDARQRNVISLIYALDVTLKNVDEAALLSRFEKDQNVRISPDTTYKYVAQAPADLTERPVVVGMGPCGLFTALILAQMGFKPILLERGKSVHERSKDTFRFWRKGELNTESNVQFGEGGAGTFSDGKLYSQVKDPGFLGLKVKQEFVAAGAPAEIIYVSKPHIGTFKLVTMVERMRRQIIELGGDIRFETRVEELNIEANQVTGVTLNGGEIINSKHITLAIGHSARDTVQMLHDKGVHLEAQSFSVGFRIEHKQEMIDKCRFGINAGHPLLGAADYKLVHHCKNGRSVYSFCMCPGGVVVAATSEKEAVVTNGMSQYSRSERNANSAIVVGVSPSDFANDPLQGIALQRKLERNAYILGGSNYDAPAQRVEDFLAAKDAKPFGPIEPSYKPNVKMTDLSGSLPDFAIAAIREALPAFDKKIRGFASADAILTGVETRTSSPVQIKRGADYQSINIKGLYPGGEGAGYAGGILSAGIDGIKIAEAVALDMLKAN